MRVLLYGHVSHRARDDCHDPLPICDLSSHDDDDLRRVSFPHRDDPKIRIKSQF